MHDRRNILSKAIERFGIDTPATSTEVFVKLRAIAKGDADDRRRADARAALKDYGEAPKGV